jgi:hypothetical protein
MLFFLNLVISVRGGHCNYSPRAQRKSYASVSVENLCFMKTGAGKAALFLTGVNEITFVPVP